LGSSKLGDPKNSSGATPDCDEKADDENALEAHVLMLLVVWLLRMTRIVPLSKLSELPGFTPVIGREFRYIQSPSMKSFQRLFRRVATSGGEDLPKSGGMLEENAIITTPDARTFFGVSYTGDLNAWTSKVHSCCMENGVLHGRISGSTFSLSNGEVLDISTCLIEAYSY